MLACCDFLASDLAGWASGLQQTSALFMLEGDRGSSAPKFLFAVFCSKIEAPDRQSRCYSGQTLAFVDKQFSDASNKPGERRLSKSFVAGLRGPSATMTVRCRMLTVLAVLLVCWSHVCRDCLAMGRQSNLKLLRERDGLAIPSTKKFLPISSSGARLVTVISEAGKRGDWQQAQRLYSAYSGAEIQVFVAAMDAAIRCSQYRQGARIYRKLCSLNINQTAPAFTSALKIHSKLDQKHAVREIWANARRECDLDSPLAAARISAAAAEGDVQTAAQVLDEMNESGIAINVGHVSASIRACWRAEGSHHNAAKYLFDLHKELGLQPNVITFACLLGAYVTAPLEDILGAYADMKKLGISPNTVFAETYLVTVLRKPSEARKDREMLIELQKRSPDRIAAAKQAISDFKAAGV